ncbi:MAG: DUF4411 family protein [Thermoguttaceae bacterium]|jgi:hypothetical protein|nr:DUF4411 family protein [Thermoguttaceae bacterium]
MSDGRRYLLDANVFIEAYQGYYAFDICPGFWQSLLRQHGAKRVFSIDKIEDELAAGHDSLSNWATDTAQNTFFKRTADKRVADAFTEMIKWVQADKQFTVEAKARFASVADGWLIAYAKTNALIVVTRETYVPDVKVRVPIPNVCLEFDVEFCNTFEMLRDLKVQFVLRKRTTK